MRRPLLRPVSRLLLVALAPLALDGCVSIGVSRTALDFPPGASAPLTGALTVSVFEKAGDRDAGRVVAFPILSELARVSDSGEEAVGRSMAPAWTLADLPPGKYRLRVTRRLTAEGDIEALENPGDKTFEVSAGKKSTVSVVLKKVPVLAAVTIVALLVLAIAGARHLPPPPPLPPLAPIFVVIPVGGHGDSGPSAPGAADIFPAKGSLVSARRVAATFLLTAPLASDGVGEDAVLALGSKSGEIAGAVSYLPRDGLLRFSPSRDFAPGETVTVTLDLSKLRGAGGREGSGKVSTSFLVPVAREE